MKFFTLAIFMLLGAAIAVAQETRGDISGTVTDPQGGLIAVATVTVTNVDTNVKTQVVTGANGFYLVPLLLTGNYQIVAEAVGFKRLVRSGLSLRLGQHMEINLTMEASWQGWDQFRLDIDANFMGMNKKLLLVTPINLYY